MPDRFPCEAVLKDGKRLYLRRLTSEDEGALYAFFQRLPENVRRMAWKDLSSRAQIHHWTSDIDYEKTLPIVAVDGARVVADATLHYRRGGPLRLVGRIRWLIDPDFRRRGLGTTLVNHFIGVARTNGLRHLSCMLATNLEAHAIEVLIGLGFKATLFPAYGIDPDGKPHDMTQMVLGLV